MGDCLERELAADREAGRISCASAHRIALACAAPASDVRRAADNLGIRVSECQLGLFGYDAYGEKRWTRRLSTIPGELERAVRAVATDGRLPCAAAWKLADDRGLPRLLLGSVAETLGLRISDCQLGCF
jgi:hypothetical protein